MHDSSSFVRSSSDSPLTWRLQLTVGIATVFAPLNSTMLAVALPAVRKHFEIGSGSATWLVSSYLVAVAVAQPVGGRLTDAFGPVRVMRAGLVLFALLSVLAACAWSFPVLVLFRCLQGVPAALLIPAGVSYLRRAAPSERLGAVLGFNGALIAAGAALGPVVGGLLLVVADWRALFLFNVPLAAGALALFLRLPAERGSGGLSVPVPSLLALFAAFSGITLLGNALRLQQPLLLAVAAAVLAGGVVAYGAMYRAVGSGVVDLRLFRRRDYAAATLANALSNLVMYTTLVGIPIYLDQVEHLGDAAIGLMLVTLSAALSGLGAVAGRLSDRFGPRPLLLSGGALLVVTSLALASAVGATGVAVIAVVLFVMGVSLALLQSPQQAVALRAVPREEAGSASGTYGLSRYVGSVTGTAILAAILTRDSGAGDFRLLFGIVSCFAVANLVAAGAIRARPPVAVEVTATPNRAVR